MPIEWVAQEEASGCGIACLAMVLGVDYETAVQLVPSYAAGRDGLTERELDEVLAEQGLAVARKWATYHTGRHGKRPAPARVPWPPAIFGEVHIACVTGRDSSATDHFVVVLRDGTVLDPADRRNCRLVDYDAVDWVAALVRLA